MKSANNAVLKDFTTQTGTFFSNNHHIHFPSLPVMEASTQYHVIVDAGAFVDAFDNEFAGISDNQAWSFTTQSPDAAPPQITTLTPSAGSTGVSIVFGSFSIQFDESVRSIGNKKVSLKRESDDATIFETITFESNSFSTFQSFFFNDLLLQASTTYYITIESGAFVDAFGNLFDGISNADDWSFTTQDPETDPPMVDSYSPNPGATSISVVQSFYSMRFNEPVQPVAAKTISLFKSADDALIAEFATSSSNFFSTFQGISFSGLLLEPDTQYYILVEAGAYEDPFGNDFAGITDKSTWSFTTQTAETNPPVISGLSPQNGSVGQSLLAGFYTIFFDESVQGSWR